MTDQNRKTLRSFYCRDYLWDLFEQMTQDLGCSMDYLINESMRHYARSRDYAPAEPAGVGAPAQPLQPAQPMASAPPPAAQPAGPWNRQSGMDHRTYQRMPAVPQAPPPGYGQPQPYAQPQYQQPQYPQPAAAPARTAGAPPPPPPRPSRPGFGAPPPAAPQPAPAQQPAGQFAGSPRGPLYLIFNNNRYVVDSDKFIIGRGSQQTDLTIRDGNISRQHCAVIHRNGNYYIKDLGSTNGIEYRGNRIESKRIEEGDAFFLCDYELRFTYQG